MKKYLFVVSLVTSIFGVTFPSQAKAVTLYNAGALGSAFREISNNFTEKYGIPVTQVTGPCGSLRERIEQEFASVGISADVYASGSIGNPQKLFDEGLSDPVVKFTETHLVALTRPGLSVTSENLLDLLLDPNIKLATSTPILDSSGDYAEDIFQKADSVKPGSFQILDDKALRLVGGAPTTVTPPTGVDTFKYILEDENLADVALVYDTVGLASVAAAPDLQIVELPDNLATNAPFNLTVLKGANPDGEAVAVDGFPGISKLPNPEGEKLAQYILSPEGQQVLSKYGFPSPYKSTSVPEGQGVAGVVLAVGVAFAQKKKLAKKQQVLVGVDDA